MTTASRAPTGSAPAYRLGAAVAALPAVDVPEALSEADEPLRRRPIRCSARSRMISRTASTLTPRSLRSWST